MAKPSFLSLFGIATFVPGTLPPDLDASVVETAKTTGKLSAGMTPALERSASHRHGRPEKPQWPIVDRFGTGYVTMDQVRQHNADPGNFNCCG